MKQELTPQMKENLAALLFYVILLGVVLTLVISGFVFRSHMEAKAYNRLTGSNVTTWDAMFVQLRVDGTPNNQQSNK